MLSTTLAIATLTAGFDKFPNSLTENMRFAMKSSVFNTNGVCAKISIIHKGLIKNTVLLTMYCIQSFINFHFFTIFFYICNAIIFKKT
jgi:hypothetical protein